MTTNFGTIPLYKNIHTSGKLPSMAVILGQSTHNYDNKPSDNFPYENKPGQLRLTTTLGLKTPMTINLGQLAPHDYSEFRGLVYIVNESFKSNSRRIILLHLINII